MANRLPARSVASSHLIAALAAACWRALRIETIQSMARPS